MHVTDNPIIALWSHPRSMSTATERIMRERGDLQVLHEPFLAYYYKHISDRQLALYEEDQDHPSDFEDVKQSIIDTGSQHPVFFKDMSYYVTPQIFADKPFLKRCHHLFLIRDPRLSIASFYKLDPNFDLQEVGLEAQWKLYEHLTSINLPTLIINAEKLASHTKPMMRKVWRFCGLRAVESAFDWSSETSPRDWQYVKGWHTGAIDSNSIRVDDRDPDLVFDQAAKNATQLDQYLNHHLPFYQRLNALALSPH